MSAQRCLQTSEIFLALILFGCGGGGGGSSDGSGGGSSNPAPTTPVISINGANATSNGVAITLVEGEKAVATVATSVGSISIVSDSNDAAAFTLSSGELTLSAPPDFEMPTDANADNIYEVTLRATNSTASASASLTITIIDLFEASGRVVDGPMAGATVFVDLNCDGELNDGEPSASSDEEGYYALTGVAIDEVAQCQPTLVALGGTDSATQTLRPRSVLKAALSDVSEEEVTVTPLSGLLAALKTEEEKVALLASVGLKNQSVSDIVSSDPWAGATQNDNPEQKALSRAVQKLNAQIAAITDTIIALVTDSETSVSELAAVTAAVAETLAETLSIVEEGEGLNSLANESSLESVIAEAYLAAEIAVLEEEAESAGETFDAALAQLEAEAKEALLAPVISQAASATALANTLLADEAVDPTSELAAAAAKTAQTVIVSEISEVISQINELEENGGSTAELVAQVAQAASNLVESLSAASVAENIKAEGGDLTGVDTDEDGILDSLDDDDDGDGIKDADDAFRLDPSASSDADSDGQPDDWNVGKSAEDSTSEPALTLDNDDDNDGVLDATDNCLLISNPGQSNNDQDAAGDDCDTDDDNDGVEDSFDNCPFASNSDQSNNDQDGLGNACDDDDDNDNVDDSIDNCPLVSNASQGDNDQDNAGDDCDTDDDNDGVGDVTDNCALVSNSGQENSDLDEEGDACDFDDDNDGVVDGLDNCPVNSNADQADLDGDDLGDACDATDDRTDVDADGYFDAEDNCPSLRNADQTDSDGDLIGDVCDDDDDGDGVADRLDTAPLNSDIGAVGFSVSRIAFEDHIDGRSRANIYGLDITQESATLTSKIEAGQIDRSNLNAFLAGEGSEEGAPKVLLFLDKLPAAGASGDFSIAIKVLDGTDATREGLERQLEGSLALTWQATSTGVEITAPSQTLTIRFREGNTALIAELNDVEPRAVTIRPEENSRYAAALEINLLNLFASELPANLPVGDYFSASENYYISVDIEQGTNPQFFFEGQSVNSLSLNATIVDVDLPVLGGESWNLVEPTASEFAGVTQLPITKSGVVEDLPTKAIALVLPQAGSPPHFFTSQTLLYGDTVIIEPDALGEEKFNVVGSSSAVSSFGAPFIELILEDLPLGSGSATLDVKLIDGRDDEFNAGERVFGANLDISWVGQSAGSGFSLSLDAATLYFVDDRDCAPSSSDILVPGNVPLSCQQTIEDHSNPLLLSQISEDLPWSIRLPLSYGLLGSRDLSILPANDFTKYTDAATVILTIDAADGEGFHIHDLDVVKAVIRLER